MSGALVVRPGDTLLVCIGERCTVEQAVQIKAALHCRLPGLADVVVLSATQVASYRPDAEADSSGQSTIQDPKSPLNMKLAERCIRYLATIKGPLERTAAGTLLFGKRYYVDVDPLVTDLITSAAGGESTICGDGRV